MNTGERENTPVPDSRPAAKTFLAYATEEELQFGKEFGDGVAQAETPAGPHAPA